MLLAVELQVMVNVLVSGEITLGLTVHYNAPGLRGDEYVWCSRDSNPRSSDYDSSAFNHLAIPGQKT